MDDTDARDLLAAWALDAVDDVERARVERAIRRDPELAEEARALLETVARLADSAALPPPAALRETVMAAAGSAPQREATRPSRTVERRLLPRRSRVAMWVAAAAVATAAVAAPTVLAIQQAGRAARAERDVAVLAEALTDPGGPLASSAVAGGGRAVALPVEDGALFVARDLAPLPPERAYQLWVIEGDEPSSAGVLEVRGAVVSAEVEGAAPGSSIALTVEPAGGSARPTTEPLVVLAREEPETA